MERAIKIDPNSDDDIDQLNRLFQMGWKTASETAFPGYGEECLILYRLQLCNCPQCREARGGIIDDLDGDPDFDDMDDDWDDDDDECDDCNGWGKPSDN